MEITIDVPGEPVAKERPRFSVRGGFVQTYTPADTVKYEALVRGRAMDTMQRLALFRAEYDEKRKKMNNALALACPLYVKVYINLPVPESWSKNKRSLALEGKLLPTGRPDKDNYEKAVFDALNGMVYRDDCQITDSFTKKRYSELPMLRIKIQPIEAFAANQNPNKEIIYTGERHHAL